MPCLEFVSEATEACAAPESFSTACESCCVEGGPTKLTAVLPVGNGTAATSGSCVTAVEADLLYAPIRGVSTVCNTLLAVRPGGWTALHVAVNNGDVEECAALLKSGADVNVTSADGTTPLHLATLAAHEEICELLLTAGANVNAVDINRMTAGDSIEFGEDPWNVKYGPIGRLLYAYGARWRRTLTRDQMAAGIAAELPKYLAVLRSDTWNLRVAPLVAWVHRKDARAGVPSLSARVLRDQEAALVAAGLPAPPCTSVAEARVACHSWGICEAEFVD